MVLVSKLLKERKNEFNIILDIILIVFLIFVAKKLIEFYLLGLHDGYVSQVPISEKIKRTYCFNDTKLNCIHCISETFSKIKISEEIKDIYKDYTIPYFVWNLTETKDLGCIVLKNETLFTYSLG
ncbi:MAG: hypothetical protein ACP5F8_02615 [Candidatus Aenigmatarchaeota archaeon]